MPRVCVHLEQSTDSDYAQYFSGVGVDYALVCRACREEPGEIEKKLRAVSLERFTEIEEGGYWEWDKNAIIGRPQILDRPTGLRFRHEEITIIPAIPDGVADLRPILSSGSGECLLLASDGHLIRLDPTQRSDCLLMNVSDSGMTLGSKCSLHVSAVGEMAAVVEARGRYGVVLDLRAGQSTMLLDRGDYYPEQTDFPAAFFQSGDKLCFVHGTDWNRLDISDPRTGCLLTDRSPTSWQRGQERPQHDLNYFHGGLAVSPGGGWIVDNGWVWHPVGVVVSWSMNRWIEDNPWESEDGTTRQTLCGRNYFWGGPLCWIDDKTVAVWGYGNDDENMLPAALLFDVETGRRVRWFAGPVGTLVFDGHLFSYSPEAGTSVWDIATGERLLHDASFCPRVYHPGVKRFVTFTQDGRVRLSRLVGE